jgi:hypothetical protein
MRCELGCELIAVVDAAESAGEPIGPAR